MPSPPSPLSILHDADGQVEMQAECYSTTTHLTVSLQNGTGHSPGSSVTTSNSSCSCIMHRNQSWASRAVWMP